MLSKFYKNKRVLVTGSSGYLAWNLLNKLSEYDCEIICLSRETEKIQRISKIASFEYIESNYDIKSLNSETIENIDIIFHLASQTSIYIAEQNPFFDFTSNVLPTQTLVEICRKNKTTPTLIFAGTSTQCGMPKKIPVNEQAIDLPETVYDFHKLQAERCIKFYTQKGLVKGTTFRLTNVYGPGPKSSSTDRGILNQMIYKALNNEVLTIYGSGEYVRDYIYSSDVVDFFESAPAIIDNIKGHHIILGSGSGISINAAIKKVAEKVSEYTGSNVKVKSIKPPDNLLDIEKRNFIADISLLKEKFGKSPEISLDNGIEKTINYMSSLTS